MDQIAAARMLLTDDEFRRCTLYLGPAFLARLRSEDEVGAEIVSAVLAGSESVNYEGRPMRLRRSLGTRFLWSDR